MLAIAFRAADDRIRQGVGAENIIVLRLSPGICSNKNNRHAWASRNQRWLAVGSQLPHESFINLDADCPVD